VHVAIYCPLLAGLLLGLGAPSLARLLPPATAARLLTGAAVAGAAATVVSLAVLASTLAGDVPALAALAGVRSAKLSSSDPVPGPVAVGAAVVLPLVLLDGARVGVVRLRALAAARRLARELGGRAGGLVVVDDDVDALALPADGGRILASRAQLAALPAGERRALLLHEAAHLRHRHHLYRLAADLAAALAPWQRPVRRAVGYATERWADEVAAAELGDRAVVARVLARSGLRAPAGAPPRWSVLAMAGRRSSVVPRVRALLAPAPRQRPGVVLAAAGLVVFAVVTAVHAQADGDRWFDAASPHASVAASHRFL
jgi:hypothetical protein